MTIREELVLRLVFNVLLVRINSLLLIEHNNIFFLKNLNKKSLD